MNISYCNINGGLSAAHIGQDTTLNWETGNIDADPLFAKPGYWGDINDPNMVVEPDDPNATWVDGDYHLKSEAGRWVSNSQSWVMDETTSPCIDRGDPNSPVGDEPDPNGGLVNMGAYGGTPEASMSIGLLPPFPPVAYWKLNETEGDIAYDSVAANDAVVFGDVVWQPEGGQVDGALSFDGTGNYVSTNFVLNPADGPFSVFAWIKGGGPGQVIISQTDGTGMGATWLSADPTDGKLMTRLMPPSTGLRIPPQPLVSEFVITDGNWHRIGFVWDGSNRILYVDEVEVAKDTQTGLGSSEGGLYIGAGKNLEPGSFFSGLIDDVRIYNRAVSP